MEILELKPQPLESRGARIRAWLKTHKNESITSATRKMQKQGFWSEQENETALLRGHRAEVHREWKRPDPNGLPHAGPTVRKDKTGAPIWKQRKFWKSDDYVLNLAELRQQQDTLSHIEILMYEEATERYGEPAIVGKLNKLSGLDVAA